MRTRWTGCVLNETRCWIHRCAALCPAICARKPALPFHKTLTAPVAAVPSLLKLNHAALCRVKFLSGAPRRPSRVHPTATRCTTSSSRCSYTPSSCRLYTTSCLLTLPSIRCASAETCASLRPSGSPSLHCPPHSRAPGPLSRCSAGRRVRRLQQSCCNVAHGCTGRLSGTIGSLKPVADTIMPNASDLDQAAPVKTTTTTSLCSRLSCFNCPRARDASGCDGPEKRRSAVVVRREQWRDRRILALCSF